MSTIRPWYRQFATLCAAKRALPATSSEPRADVDRLMKRIVALEAGRKVGGDSLTTVVKGGKDGVQPKYIPAAQLSKWQSANVGKCFRFHLKGSCPSKAGECPHGTHE